MFHHTISKNMERYYQQITYVGKDRQISKCILWYKPEDILKRIKLEKDNSIFQFVPFITNIDKCRRSIIISYFSESFNEEKFCAKCDLCLLKKKKFTKVKKININGIVQLIDKIIRINKKKVISPLQLVDIIFGSNQSLFIS